MTIESTLERIAVALEKLANAKPVPVSAPVEPVKTVAVPSVAPDATLVITQTMPPVINVVPTPTPAPVVETVTAPVAVPATNCPIKTGKELMDYVMAAYKALGAAKGAEIQTVLNSIGCSAINEVRPDQYAALYAGIEALKA